MTTCRPVGNLSATQSRHFRQPPTDKADRSVGMSVGPKEADRTGHPSPIPSRVVAARPVGTCRHAGFGPSASRCGLLTGCLNSASGGSGLVVNTRIFDP